MTFVIADGAPDLVAGELFPIDAGPISMALGRRRTWGFSRVAERGGHSLQMTNATPVH